MMKIGVNFMEKTVSLRGTEITFSIWDLGGQREFLSMLPLVCNEAVAIFFMFDLSRKSTLLSIKEWYRQARGLNRVSGCSGQLYVCAESLIFRLRLNLDCNRLLSGNQVRSLLYSTS